MTNKLLITIAAAVMLLTACDMKDPIYETDHPEKAKITVTTDWSNIGQGISKPSGYTVAFDGKTFPATADKHTLPDLIEPGNYTLYFYNNAEYTAVNATTVRADYPEGMPGWFFTGRLDAAIEKDKHHEFTVTMQQQVRQLTLAIEFTGTTTDKVKSITGTLSGAAGSLDFGSGMHGSPSDVTLPFIKDTNGKWKTTVRLLGVTGAEQKLKGTISFMEGTPGDMLMESDLTADLATFNDNKKEPMTLGGQTTETPSPAGFTVTINDWKKIASGTGTAD